MQLDALAEVLPPTLVAEVLEEAGRRAKRQRKLPPQTVAWLVVGMALFRQLSILNVLRRLADSLGAGLNWGLAELPHATSVSHARDRLGWEAVRLLFRRFAALLRSREVAQWRWRGLEVLTLDGTCFMAPDSDANDAVFGRAGASRGGRSGFPQLRAVMLMEAWTHVVLDAAFGPYRTHELRLAETLLRSVGEQTLLLLDRAFDSFTFLWTVRSRGCHFVVRLRSGRCVNVPVRRKKLGRDDYLASVRCPRYLARRRPDLPETLEVRVVTLHRKGFRPLVVMTSLLDPEAHPARELIELYFDRWEAELAYRELKVHMGNAPVAFRSHTPTRVLQEAYGHLVAYNAVRALMARAAEDAGVQPRRLSFVDCLERVRWAIRDLPGTPMHSLEERLLRLLGDLARCQLPEKRRGRRCDRAVKIKMSNWPRKRRGQASAPTARQRQEMARAGASFGG